MSEIAADFNSSQGARAVNALYTGDGTEAMTAAIAAVRAGGHPEIVRVFEASPTAGSR